MSDVEVLEVEAPTGEESVAETSTEAPEESAELEPTEEVAEGSIETDSDGQPRDEHGRFAPKSSQADPQAEPTAPAAPTDNPLAPPEAQSDGQPFVFKADKREYTIEGARHFPGEGLYVPESEIQRTQQLLSQGVYLEQNWKRQEQEWQQRIQAAEAKAAPKDLVEREQRASALLAELQAVLSDEDKLVEFVQNLQTNGPALMERARARMLEERLAKFENAERQTTTQAETEKEQQDKANDFNQTIEEMKSDARFKAFGEDDWREFIEEMADLESVIFVRLGDDGPEGPGLYLNQGLMVKAAERRAALLNKAQTLAMSKVQGVQKAVKFNAQRTAPKVQSPPAAPAPAPAAETPKNWDEWKQKNGLYL